MRLYSLSCVLTLAAFAASPLQAQSLPTEQVQIGPPPMRRAEPPAPGASVEELEKRADELRGQKDYLDAIDYYREALMKQPSSAQLHNKAGITELMLQHYNDARRDFERAIRLDREDADAYNNLGVIFYLEKKDGRAIKQYEKAITLRQDSASF